MKIKEAFKKNKIFVIIGSVFAFAMICSLCGFLFWFLDDPDENSSPDLTETEVITPPENIILITQPTNRDWFTTTQDLIDLSGIYEFDGTPELSDAWITINDQSEKVPFVIDDGEWRYGLHLDEGDNYVKISIVQGDAIYQDSITVVKSEYGIGNELTTNIEFLPLKDVETEVIFSIETEREQNENLWLFQVDEYGSEDSAEKVAQLQDNGKGNHGDLVAGDNIYSLKLLMSAEDETPLHFRIGLDRQKPLLISGLLELPVYDEPTQESFSSLIKKFDEIQNEYDRLASVIEGEDTDVEIANTLVGWLNQQLYITVAGTSENGTGIWWEMKESGLLGGISQTNDQMRAEGDKKINGLINRSHAQEETGIESVQLGNQKAVYLGSYYSSFEPYDDYDFALDEVKQSSCPKYQIKEEKEKDVSVDDYKTLDQFGLIIISSHGDTWFENQLGVKRGYVVVHTDQQMGLKEYIDNYPDLKAQRLAVRLRPDGYYFSVLPKFIERYNGGMPNSIVYMGSCRSAYNSTMAEAFLGAGAKAYFGFSEYVHSGYAYNSSGNLFNKFISGNEHAYNAYLAALRSAGSEDGANPTSQSLSPARFIMYGENELVEKEDLCCDQSCISGTYTGKTKIQDPNKYNLGHYTEIDATITINEDGNATGTINIVEPKYTVVLDPDDPNPLVLDTRSAYGDWVVEGIWDTENEIITYAATINGADVAEEVENGGYHSIELSGAGNYTLDSSKGGVQTEDLGLYLNGALGAEKLHLFLDLDQQIQHRMWLEKID